MSGVPDPDPPVLGPRGAVGPDPVVNGTDPDSSIIKQKY
jgi:hypothetical protein